MDYEHAVAVARNLFETHTYGRSSRPLMEHLLGVVDLLRDFGHDSEEQLIVGLHHDTLEDSSWTRSDLIEHFGDRVASAVHLCSDGEGADRESRKRIWAAKWSFARNFLLQPHSPLTEEGKEECRRTMILAQRAKMADRIFNVRSCVEHGNDNLLKRYQTEHHLFKSTLQPEDGDPMWEVIESIITQV